MEGCGLDSYRSGQEVIAGSCKHANDPFGSIKGELNGDLHCVDIDYFYLYFIKFTRQ
jgi:hypothetical protein